MTLYTSCTPAVPQVLFAVSRYAPATLSDPDIASCAIRKAERHPPGQSALHAYLHGSVILTWGYVDRVNALHFVYPYRITELETAYHD